MHVQNVQAVDFGHLRHARGQRQIVGRILEQRVLRNRDLVEVDLRVRGVQPDRLLVGDEVNLVAAVRQLNAQLGTYNSASAVSGVTGDSDFHYFCRCVQLPWIQDRRAAIHFCRQPNLSSQGRITTYIPETL
jgi:hypothetical protein